MGLEIGVMKKILITGANGFVGSHLVDYLLGKNYQIVATVRKLDPSLDLESKNIHWVETGEISPQTDWANILKGIEVIVHLAQRAHVMNENAANPEEIFKRINVDSLQQLATQATKAGVKKFIFLSSIKVNGEFTREKPFNENDIPNPTDFYGISKLDAEKLLLDLAEKLSMRVVIIRPPLVYGKGVPGNFKSLVRLLKKGIFIPFGSIYNKRSLVGVTNLCDFVESCILNPKADNETFLISDDQDISTTVLVNTINQIIGLKSKIIPFPVIILKLALRFIGKSSLSTRLFGSLQVDISKAKGLLGWRAPYPLEYDIKNAVEVNL